MDVFSPFNNYYLTRLWEKIKGDLFERSDIAM